MVGEKGWKTLTQHTDEFPEYIPVEINYLSHSSYFKAKWLLFHDRVATQRDSLQQMTCHFAFLQNISISLFSYRLDLGLPGYTWKTCRNLSRPTFHFFFLPGQDFSGGRGQLRPALGMKSSGRFQGWQSACTSKMAVAPEPISVLQDPSQSSW